MQEYNKDIIIMPKTTFARKKIILTASAVLSAIPQRHVYSAASILKKLKSLNGKNLNSIYSLQNSERMMESGNKTPPTPEFRGGEFAVCMTHDIDYARGYEFVPEMFELGETYEIKSCWNFLANGPYGVDKKLINKLIETGHEVGLHGLKHDIAFGFRNREKIKKQLKESLSRLDISACGFRAPALSYSTELVSVLSELGFAYDSSIPDRELGLCHPYRMVENGLWELPITTPQDSELIRDWGLSEDESLNMLKSKINKIRQLRGVAVLLFHPCIARDNLGLYERVLEHINSEKNCLLTTPNQLINQL